MTLRGHKGYVYSTSFSPDGRMLVSCGMDHMIKIWNTGGCHCTEVTELDVGAVCAATIAPNGSLLGVATWNGSVSVRRVANGEVMQNFTGYQGAV